MEPVRMAVRGIHRRVGLQSIALWRFDRTKALR
jgi:hypothetical protein